MALTQAEMEKVGTLGALLLHTVDGPPKPDLLRTKVGDRWVDISSSEVKAAVAEIAAALVDLGVKRGDRVAILAENRPQWLMADYAILGLGAVTVPIYGTLIPETIAYILKDSGSVGVFVSTKAQAQKVAAVRGGLPDLRFVIAMDADVRDAGDVLSWDQVAARGRERLKGDPGLYQREVAATQPGDLATLIYTSGTTGEPKGVMLTHDNLVSNVRMVANLAEFNAQDVGLSFLPLSHVFERMADFCYMACGATIAYCPAFDKVMEYVGEVKPTVVGSVPRLYEKIYAGVLEKSRTLTGLQGAIFRWGLSVAAAAAKEKIAGRAPSGLLKIKYDLADRLVLSKIRARTGGRLRFFISGGAPLARDIAEFFYGLGLPILEGYGLSETSPVISVNTPAAMKFGTVGRPMPGVQVKIASDGEILCKGPNVMMGYFGKADATREVFEDGWFKTGDIGHLDADGYLVITDRKKDLFKTSGGKYIAPQPIENALKGDDIVSQAVVIGDSRKFPAVLIVPNLDAVRKRLGNAGLPGDAAECARHPKVRELFDKHLASVNQHLSQYERIKKFELLPTEFTLESGELTPTMKVKRKVVNERYKGVIEKMYSEPAPGRE